MKFRFKLTQIREYEPNPEYYPEGRRTPEEMLKIDLEAANDDPSLFFDILEDVDSKVEGEIVE